MKNCTTKLVLLLFLFCNQTKAQECKSFCCGSNQNFEDAMKNIDEHNWKLLVAKFRQQPVINLKSSGASGSPQQRHYSFVFEHGILDSINVSRDELEDMARVFENPLKELHQLSEIDHPGMKYMPNSLRILPEGDYLIENSAPANISHIFTNGGADPAFDFIYQWRDSLHLTYVIYVANPTSKQSDGTPIAGGLSYLLTPEFSSNKRANVIAINQGQFVQASDTTIFAEFSKTTLINHEFGHAINLAHLLSDNDAPGDPIGNAYLSPSGIRTTMNKGSGINIYSSPDIIYNGEVMGSDVENCRLVYLRRMGLEGGDGYPSIDDAYLESYIHITNDQIESSTNDVRVDFCKRGEILNILNNGIPILAEMVTESYLDLTFTDNGSYEVVVQVQQDSTGYSVSDTIDIIIELELVDADGDGFSSEDDCDDNNPNVNPNQIEEPYNGIDDDCNSATLDDDLDQDGFLLADDCDDNNPNINPDQTEQPYNELDDDCNSATLDDDLDQDGFLLADDCDDNNPNVNPNQTEQPYNGLDDDCNSATLDDDLDQDGFLLANDCDDNNPNINPDAEEIPNNGIDEDCDGNDLMTSTYEFSNSTLNIFPNPAIDIINIAVDGQINYNVSLIDLEGKLIKSSNNSSRIKIETIPQGTYLLQIKDLKTGQKIVERIVIGK